MATFSRMMPRCSSGSAFCIISTSLERMLPWSFFREILNDQASVHQCTRLVIRGSAGGAGLPESTRSHVKDIIRLTGHGCDGTLVRKCCEGAMLDKCSLSGSTCGSQGYM